MKKLLITGDSYCASGKKESWTKILADKLNAKLTVAGAVSASLFYAYDNLVNLDDEHDYVITLITNPGRLYLPNPPYFSNPYTARQYKAKAETENDTESYLKFKAGELYYENLSNEKYDNFIHDTIIEKIEGYLKDRNAIVYPNFKMSRYPTEYFTMLSVTDACFSRYFDKSDYSFYVDIFQKYLETENVINHTTVECQELIAEHFYQLLTTSKSTITLQDFKDLKLNSFEYYFTPR